jgi:hypothetical protein
VSSFRRSCPNGSKVKFTPLHRDVRFGLNVDIGAGIHGYTSWPTAPKKSAADECRSPLFDERFDSLDRVGGFCNLKHQIALAVELALI